MCCGAVGWGCCSLIEHRHAASACSSVGSAAEERGRMLGGQQEGLFILSNPMHNAHNMDDWGYMFCRTVTVENKCIHSCLVYGGCQQNGDVHGPGARGGKCIRSAVAHGVSL